VTGNYKRPAHMTFDPTGNNVVIFHHPGHYHYWFHPKFYPLTGGERICSGNDFVEHLWDIAHMVLGPDVFVKAIPMDRV
jgi:hypothetical protein